MASRRARLRQQAKSWQQPTEPAPIDWAALQQDLAKREQQPVQRQPSNP